MEHIDQEMKIDRSVLDKQAESVWIKFHKKTFT